MFEAHVLYVLRKYLGEYVHGLSTEALRISVWKGDVVLKDLKLKAEALNSLKLPVTVKAGFIGTITIKVPWKSLGNEPVIVLIDRVFVLAHPVLNGRTLKQEDREKLFEAKLQQIEEAESATLEAITKSKSGNSPSENSWLGSLISTIIGNLKISISNVHIRYEDSVSNPGNAFSVGVTLAKLAAVTMDEEGNETFDTSAAVDRLRKSLQLERLAMYHDSKSPPWKINNEWRDLNPKEWIEIFEVGINEPATNNEVVSTWASNRNYLVSPINGVLKYHRLGKQERNDPEIPFEMASLVLSDVSLTITEAQYHDWIKLLEAVSRYKTYVEISHLRPMVPVSEDCKLWWHYAKQAVLQQRKICYRLSWDQIRHLCQLRRRYVKLYAGSLQRMPDVNCLQIREIEQDLDPKVILLWRLLAHAKVESVRSKEASERQRHRRRSWFSFSWHGSSEDSSIEDDLEGPQEIEKRLTKEEWKAVNKLLSFQPDEELNLHSGKEMHNMILLLVNVSIGQAAARIISINQTEIVCGRFEKLHVSTKFKNRGIHCDVLLKFYGLSSPEGPLTESVCSGQKVNALTANFVRMPVGENVDWRLSATISPCHVTVLMETYDRFVEFVKRSHAVSPTVALEAATALQMKFEKVTRRAQEQLQMVLEEQSRFALDIDFDAPKVRVPMRSFGSLKCESHFLLDFGHFTLHTKESQFDEHRQGLYSRFYIYGRDIAAFFTDCSSNGQNCSLASGSYDNPLATSPILGNSDKFYSLIDKCGMAVIVDQIKVPHPSYPSTRVSVQVPYLAIHFSPARYCRMMELLSILYGTMEDRLQSSQETSQSVLAPWSPADLASEARILVWRGIGNSMAAWHPCFLVLSGSYLYVLESEKSQKYQRCSSMFGKQVFVVPPTNIGGALYCVALGSRGMDIQKALESSTTLVVEFPNEDEEARWLKGLTKALYRASAPPSVDVLGESPDVCPEFDEPEARQLKTADVVINGAVVETKLLIYGKVIDELQEKHEETLIVEVVAGGAKVHIVCLESDLTVKMKLHSLDIIDELQGSLSSNPQYLAYSVQKNTSLNISSHMLDAQDMEASAVVPEEDDIFKDALQDFASLTDPGLPSLLVDMAQCMRAVNDMESAGVGCADVFPLETDMTKGKGICGDIFYEAQDIDKSDFVSVIFSTKNPGSPDYVGIDTEMSIRMSKLELFCNRPTVVALIGFGLDISSMNSKLSGTNMTESLDDQSSLCNEKTEETGLAFVKGLLGFGKARVVFLLSMNVDSVTVSLNKEDGSRLAMFVQESFLLDLKVHPSSLSIEGTLGNFRLSDLSLGTDHCWGWLFDIRNPGVESLIKFKFNSYSVDDDDYEGYDYSLSGRLSAVRIVFLYRFILEIMAYFMELATPHTEEAIKLVDKVGDFEWWIQKYEIDGASALKLDLSLDTPIIIIPRHSLSKDSIQLDLSQLRVTNEFHWYGFPEKDPSAVHVDVLHAEIFGINMAVGVDGFVGEPLIREGQGFDVYVRRSLRDVFRKVPTLSIEVKVGLLHGLMSDKEYSVILDCVYMNLYELPRLPVSFRGSAHGSKDTMRLLVDKVNMNSQTFLSRNVTILAVKVNYALLELCNGVHEKSPLAQLALEGLWVSYRMTSLSETDLYVTIPKFSVIDIRPNTKPEMRLMLGSSTDDSKHAFTGSIPFPSHRSGLVRTSSRATGDIDLQNSTMFLMDYRWRISSKSCVVRIQQPRILVVPDFLLAVGEFFVPALGTITGREEAMDPKNDPLINQKSIILSEPIYKQTDGVVQLSPDRQLVADCFGVCEYTYDGCGNTLYLSDEMDSKEHTPRSRPIIFIGRGKRLRFVNVKIQNGSLLRKYTYLSIGSSYSVSFEDGVDISLMDRSAFGNEKSSQQCTDEPSGISLGSMDAQEDSSKIPSFNFEAQVVSPEFTFYDITKSSLDDSSHGEKLLCAKMDLSFMYASKGNDTWIRALVKDLNIEAGSGLVILDPVDILGGYTSVKDKSNMSLILTDVCIHLSLSALSLVLNLQSQVAAALQFGNDNPLSPCTNFDRVWVSSKENGPFNKLTFWRPRAPTNYVILGDCVTSRAVPPSHAVMAVSNTYGRVRKPVGFRLIGSFSSIEMLELCDGDSDCSIWMPVPPPGYSAFGCVAHMGTQEPPNHIVYCLRSDLVTSTTYSECIFSATSNPLFLSEFSIWRLENVVGSFYAHPSKEYPPNDRICDLSYILLGNSNQCHSSPRHAASDPAVEHIPGNQHGGNESVNYSGWDIIRTISRGTSCYMSTPHFERVWWDKGSDIRRAVSIWRPLQHPGYAILGDCITEGLEPPALGILFKDDSPAISAKPVQFTKVAHIMGKGFDEAFFWYPVAPPGYASMGCIVSKIDEAPSMDMFCCPRMDLVNQANIPGMPISRSSGSKTSSCWSLWKVENQACTFLARADFKKPSNHLAYSIGHDVKPKTQENVTAEVKLRCFSLTVLDSLCGMMTPLFDMTITNIKLATHGRLEAMNAVFISSIAASAFNTQLEAWEPLVEPFDGIFKFETYDHSENPQSNAGNRLRIAATSVVNINVSASNLDTFTQTVVSWRKQREIEGKAAKLNMDSASHYGDGDDSTFSALDVDEFRTVIIENKLGCDIYVKQGEQSGNAVELVHENNFASVWIPPPTFSDRLNVADASREARFYVTVHIFEAKGLTIIDDGNGHNFFCTLRLVVDSQATDQQKLFPQSARTKCCKPVIFKDNDSDKGSVTWNELFIFEVPRKGQAILEVEVTNLAAKAGKGEVVGAFSFSIGCGVNMLKKVASARMLHPQVNIQNIVSYPLRGKVNPVQSCIAEGMHDSGYLLVSTTYFERKTLATLQERAGGHSDVERDVGFLVGLSPDGNWESFRSLLPLSVVPKKLEGDFIAMEVIMKNGKKHAVIRGLATVVNETDIDLDISVCHINLANRKISRESDSHNIVVEEVFENQRYHPISGWGNNWLGFRANEPGHWSTRDFSYSSKDFPELQLPPHWKWVSAWTVDKPAFVDFDGWFYGPDYQSLKWPPSSSSSCTKSASDAVRRRRWIRTRQENTETGTGCMNNVFSLGPRSSTVLPWRSLHSKSNQCLQVRPHIDYPLAPYSWGNAVTVGSGYVYGKDQPSMNQDNLKQRDKMVNSLFKLSELGKKDVLLLCCPSNGRKEFWISMGVDGSVLPTEINTPVYDWKISIHSPFKMENRLPCPAEFTIWEKTKEGTFVERQQGIISSGKSVHIYAADVLRPIYLTMFVQGGWVLEKDPVLVLDLSSNDHVSSFWMVHQRSKRRLRVSIERDLGGTTAAPKTLRFFVPYWIANDSPLSLAYRVVAMEAFDTADPDHLPLSRAVKSARIGLKSPTMTMDRRYSVSRKNIKVLEEIDETTPTPSMLSPQDYAGLRGIVPFPSHTDAYPSPRVGISVAIQHSEKYCPGISLLELEKQEHVDLMAFSSDGSYYKLSATLNMTADRTKVVHFQPQTLFINRVGYSICLQQCDTHLVEWIHPTDPPKTFEWQSSSKSELLKLRLNGYHWSTPFSIGTEGLMCISLKNDTGNDQIQVRVEVRTGTKSSHYEVIFRPNSLSSPYRIENRSMFLPICFRQVDGSSECWHSLFPNSAAAFFWEDLGRQRLLELLLAGSDPSTSEKYNIDEISDHQPVFLVEGSSRALCITIIKEEKMNVVRVSDWMPENEYPANTSRRLPVPVSQCSRNDSQHLRTLPSSNCEFHVIVELAELGLSVIDHTPEEILYLSVPNFMLSYSTGLGSGISRFKLRIRGIQVDNQLPLTLMPVLFRPQRVGGETDYFLKLSITMQSNGSLDFCVYPYIGFHGPENSACLINIHEPIIWRLHEMIQQLNLSRLYDGQATSVSVDPIIQIGVLNISEVRLKVSMTMSPTQRPRGVLGFWSSLMTALGNTENMPVRINQRFHENVCMRQSTLINHAVTSIQKDLLGQPLQLLSGVDILGNASSALGHMSKGVAALSMDKKFIQSRMRQESKNVGDFSDVIREGGGALAKGLFRGVTGILTKPLEGAKTSGVEGFVQGVGKGLIGAAAQPVSGVLDLLSKTTEGANAVRMKIASAITSEEQLLRRRLPRVISGDNLLRPYDEYKAQGQVILQLAECGSFFGQVDLFKVRGKFALSDAYEDHFLLPKGKILAVTHRRVMLLQQPMNIIGQRKFSPARDPCSVLWDVSWDCLMTMELTHGKKDQPKAPPSLLILYLHTRSAELKDQVRYVKCIRESNQALEVYTSIERAMSTYGTNQAKELLKKKVTRPYSPVADDVLTDIVPKGVSQWSSQHVSASPPPSSTFGSSTS